MTHIICRLTAKYRDQLRNPTLGNRVWATFTFFTFTLSRSKAYNLLLSRPDDGTCSVRKDKASNEHYKYIPKTFF